MEAITREEKIISGENLTPVTRKEMFLAKAAGQDVQTPTPITREEIFLSKISQEGTVGDQKISKLVDGTITSVTQTDLQGCTNIKDYAFYLCTSLQNINIPNSVESIKGNAFYYCSSLTRIIIPSSVSSIGNRSLRIASTTDKATIIFLSNIPPTIAADTFDATKLSKIIVPSGYGNDYKSATNWSAFADYIEEAAG